MKNPFAFGVALGEKMTKDGWNFLGKSEEKLQQEANTLASHGLPNENEENRNTGASGILYAWSRQNKHWESWNAELNPGLW